MSVVRDCIHARMTRSLHCEAGRRICAGEQCSEFVRYDVEREPTGHPWILTTNKYYKRNENGLYAKGIITFGETYILTVRADSTCALWHLTVSKNKEPVCTGARFGKIRHAIQAGSDIVKHLIAEDIHTPPPKRQLRAEDAPRDKHQAAARQEGTPA